MLRALETLLATLSLAGIPAIHAELVVWQFQNASFDDGAAANGKFTVDTDLGTVTDFEIFTDAGGTLLSPFLYNTSTAQITGQAIATESGQGYFLQIDSLAGEIAGATRELHLSFSGPLVPTQPASVVSDGTPGRVSYEHMLAGERSQQRVLDNTGSLNLVPEPTGLICLGFGLTAIGLVAMRQRAVAV